MIKEALGYIKTPPPPQSGPNIKKPNGNYQYKTKLRRTMNKNKLKKPKYLIKTKY